VTPKWLLAQGAAIHDEWEGRLQAKAAKPYDTPNGYLKREVYRLVRHCIATQTVETLQALVADDDCSPRPTAYNKQDPFYWGLMFVFGMDRRVCRKTRERFANELLYAHKHNVPPELLVGFIYQIGNSNGLRKRILNAEMEEWHEEN